MSGQLRRAGAGVRFFFYGTLRDAEVRRRVLGRAPQLSGGIAAILAGYRSVVASGRSYPTLAVAQAEVCGDLFEGITPAQRCRLARFEGNEYRETWLTVTTAEGERCEALVFMPRRPPLAGAPDWSMAWWRRYHKRRFLRALERDGF